MSSSYIIPPKKQLVRVHVYAHDSAGPSHQDIPDLKFRLTLCQTTKLRVLARSLAAASRYYQQRRRGTQAQHSWRVEAWRRREEDRPRREEESGLRAKEVRRQDELGMQEERERLLKAEAGRYRELVQQQERLEQQARSDAERREDAWFQKEREEECERRRARRGAEYQARKEAERVDAERKKAEREEAERLEAEELEALVRQKEADRKAEQERLASERLEAERKEWEEARDPEIDPLLEEARQNRLLYQSEGQAKAEEKRAGLKKKRDEASSLAEKRSIWARMAKNEHYNQPEQEGGSSSSASATGGPATPQRRVQFNNVIAYKDPENWTKVDDGEEITDPPAPLPESPRPQTPLPPSPMLKACADADGGEDDSDKENADPRDALPRSAILPPASLGTNDGSQDVDDSDDVADGADDSIDSLPSYDYDPDEENILPPLIEDSTHTTISDRDTLTTYEDPSSDSAHDESTVTLPDLRQIIDYPPERFMFPVPAGAESQPQACPGSSSSDGPHTDPLQPPTSHETETARRGKPKTKSKSKSQEEDGTPRETVRMHPATRPVEVRAARGQRVRRTESNTARMPRINRSRRDGVTKKKGKKKQRRQPGF